MPWLQSRRLETVAALKEYTGELDQKGMCLKIVNRVAFDKGPNE